MYPGLTEDQESTGRLYVRLPTPSIGELMAIIERSGLTRSQFLAMSVMMGARALDRALNPQQMMTPAVVTMMAEQMMNGMMDKDALKKMFLVFSEEERKQQALAGLTEAEYAQKLVAEEQADIEAAKKRRNV